MSTGLAAGGRSPNVRPATSDQRSPDARHPAVIFDVGNVLIRWDVRLLYRQLLPDEAAIDAFLAEIDFHAWNLEFDRGADWDAGVATLAARHPHHAELIRAFHDRWHETVPGAIDGSVAILADLAAAGVPLYAITNFSAPKWAETAAASPSSPAASATSSSPGARAS